LTVKVLPETAAKRFGNRRSILFLTGSLIVSLLAAGGFLFWRPKGTVRWAVLSPDGKFYAYTLT
jgi:hypothetical protein